MPADIMEVLGDGWLDVNQIAVLTNGDWHEVASALHALAREGKIARRQSGNDWQFAKLGTPEIEPVPEVEIPRHFSEPPKWTPADGTHENVWNLRGPYSESPPPPGCRVAWSCQWIGDTTTFVPPPAEGMDRDLVLLELADYAAQGQRDAAGHIAALSGTSTLPQILLLKYAQDFLRGYRPYSHEFNPAWTMGHPVRQRVMTGIRWRDGWRPPLPSGWKVAIGKAGGYIVVDAEGELVVQLSEFDAGPGIGMAEKRFAEHAVREANLRGWQW